MEKPEYAPEILRKIMAGCWKHNPDDRITFDELEQTLGQLVNENTRHYFTKSDSEGAYIQLNPEEATEYLDMSTGQI